MNKISWYKTTLTRNLLIRYTRKTNRTSDEWTEQKCHAPIGGAYTWIFQNLHMFIRSTCSALYIQHYKPLNSNLDFIYKCTYFAYCTIKQIKGVHYNCLLFVVYFYFPVFVCNIPYFCLRYSSIVLFIS